MKIKRFVRQSLFFLGLFISSQVAGTMSLRAEILPDIEAHEAKATVVQKSKTGRVYRFKMERSELPKTGNIILVSEDQKPLMAIRVLKTEEAVGEFIGKRVRRYDTLGELKVNEAYTTVEKLADLVAPPAPEPGQYNPDASPELDPNSKAVLAPIKNKKNNFDSNAQPELDPGRKMNPDQQITPPLLGSDQKMVDQAKRINGMDVEKFDQDLDSSTSPQTPKPKKKISADEELENELAVPHTEKSSDDVTDDFEAVTEESLHHPYRNTIALQIGSYKNMSGFKTEAVTNSAFGAIYEHLLDRNVFISRSKTQDSLSFETGFLYYSRSDFTGNQDDYTLLPIKAELHHNLHFSPTFTLFSYFGLQYNFLMSYETSKVATSASAQAAIDAGKEAGLKALTGIQPTLGVGVYYNIGPQWFLRGDLGWDRVAIGLAVKW